MNNEVQPIHDPGDPQEKLEQLITALCRVQPPLSMPTGLHSRIIAAVERRAHQWWRAPLRAWPAWAQAALLVLCVGCIWLATRATVWSDGSTSIGQWLLMPWMLADIFTSLFAVLCHLLWLALSISPLLWLFAMAVSGVVILSGVMGLNRLTARHT